ncbi:VTT domain-containing protein [Rhodoferax sp.]|uniref:TVP38/TMEM64 family protein n=1 Tax=Rhodoferax sp. TaxID=50421 RepID=UPI001ED548C6|nr:VTT domain-containing protein [Rhodoferax sp.]MBT9506399.1 TVP38/TMEM64 family protein [Rhodoferax sp.]
MSMAHDRQKRLRLRLLWLLAALVVLIGLAAAWSWSPLRTWLDMDLMVASLRRVGQSFGFVAAVTIFALAVAAAVPLIFLTLVCIVAFGPWIGAACTLLGALVGACLSYGLGKYLGREALEHFGGARVNALSQQLARRGVLAVIAVRLVPVAPFAIVNMIAGASHIRLRDLLLGTAVGMTPGTVAMMIFMEQIMVALKQPSAGRIWMVALTLLLIVLGVWGLRRWMRHSRAQ